jgi:hypothetical protein
LFLLKNLGAIQKSYNLKNAKTKYFWTLCNNKYNIHGHELAVKSTGTSSNRGGGR